MSNNFDEDDFEEFEESNSVIKENDSPNVINDVRIDLKELVSNLYLNYKVKFNIKDELFYDKDKETDKQTSFFSDLTANKNNRSTVKIKEGEINNFYLDIEKNNQNNLWGNLLLKGNKNLDHEINLKSYDYNELISICKKFEKTRKNRKKQPIEKSNVSNTVIKNLYSKYIDLKNIYLNLSNITLESLFYKKVVNDTSSKKLDNLTDFSFIEDLQQTNGLVDFKKSDEIMIKQNQDVNRSPNLSSKKNLNDIENTNNFETLKTDLKRNLSDDKCYTKKNSQTIDHSNNINI